MQPVQGVAVPGGGSQLLGGALRQVVRPIQQPHIQHHAVIDGGLQRGLAVHADLIQPGVPFRSRGAGIGQDDGIGVIAQLLLAQGGQVVLQLIIEGEHFLQRQAVPLGDDVKGLAGAGGIAAAQCLTAAQIALQVGDGHDRADGVYAVLQPDIFGELHRFVLLAGAVVIQYTVHEQQKLVAVHQGAEEFPLEIKPGGLHQCITGGAHDGIGELFLGQQIFFLYHGQRKGGDGVLRRDIFLIDKAVQHGVTGLVEVAFPFDIAHRVAVIFHPQGKGELVKKGDGARQNGQPENGGEEIGDTVQGAGNGPAVIPPGVPAACLALGGFIPQCGDQRPGFAA